MTGEALPDDLAARVVRVDELVQHFEQHPDPLVREQVIDLLRQVDGLHRDGLARLAHLLRAAGLERRALEDAEVRLLYTLYDLDDQATADARPPVASPRGSFVPLANLLGQANPRG